MNEIIKLDDERRRREELRRHVTELIASIREGRTPNAEFQAWITAGAGGFGLRDLTDAIFANAEGHADINDLLERMSGQGDA
jgi:hypothetical protein